MEKAYLYLSFDNMAVFMLNKNLWCFSDLHCWRWPLLTAVTLRTPDYAAVTFMVEPPGAFLAADVLPVSKLANLTVSHHRSAAAAAKSSSGSTGFYSSTLVCFELWNLRLGGEEKRSNMLNAAELFRQTLFITEVTFSVELKLGFPTRSGKWVVFGPILHRQLMFGSDYSVTNDDHFFTVTQYLIFGTDIDFQENN